MNKYCYETFAMKRMFAVLDGVTPYEKFYNTYPKLSHLKLFGCEAYPLDLGTQKCKFEARAKKNCILIGYGEKEGIYWIYDKYNKQIFKSRDVQFNEKAILDQQNDIELNLETEKENKNM